MIRLLLCFLFFSNLGLLFGQVGKKVSKEALEQLEHPNYPDADFAYLNKSCRVFYRFVSESAFIVTEYKTRIKVYKDKVDEIGNVSIYTYKNGSTQEKVSNVKATCWNLESGEIVISKLNGSEVYETEISEEYNKVTFAIPKVRAGSVIEFSYSIRSPFLYSFPRHYFQSGVPVDYSALTVEVPRIFTMAPSPSGSVSLDVKSQEIDNGFKATRYTYVAKDVPPLKADDYVLNISDYRSSLKYELSDVTIPGWSQTSYSSSWESIGKNLLTRSRFGGLLNHKYKFASEFLDSCRDLPKDKQLKEVVAFVKRATTFNNEISVLGSVKASEFNKSLTGNSANINLCLISLLRNLGFEAYPVLTKGRSEGVLNTFFPSLTELDLVFCAVNYEGKLIYLDASHDMYEFGTLPLSFININGVLVDPSITQVVGLVNTHTNKVQKLGQFSFDPETQTLNGVGRITRDDFAAVKYRIMQGKPGAQDGIKQALVLEDVLGITEKDAETDLIPREDKLSYEMVLGKDTKSGRVRHKYEASIKSVVESIDDLLFINAFGLFELLENPVAEEKREFPVFFNSKLDFDYITIIKLPEGYQLTESPGNKVIALPEAKGKFEYMVSSSPSTITIKCKLKTNTDIFRPQECGSLHQFFQQIIELQKGKIILAKI